MHIYLILVYVIVYKPKLNVFYNCTRYAYRLQEKTGYEEILLVESVIYAVDILLSVVIEYLEINIGNTNSPFYGA